MTNLPGPAFQRSKLGPDTLLTHLALLDMRQLIALTALALLACSLGPAAAVRPLAPPPPPHRGLIANGDAAAPGQFPYMCALGRADKGSDTVEMDLQACGATLIHPSVVLTGAGTVRMRLRCWMPLPVGLPAPICLHSPLPSVVLTAAHCAGDGERGVVRRGQAVLCGATRLGATSGAAQFRRISQARAAAGGGSSAGTLTRLLHILTPTPEPTPAHQVALHPASKEAAALAQRLSAGRNATTAPEPSFTAGDVALQLLDRPITSLAPVAVASPDDWAAIGRPGAELRVAGWGATVPDLASPRAFPRTLQEAAVPLVPPDR